MPARLVTYLRDSLTFLAGFVRHPLATGALLPSSRALAMSLLRIGNIVPGSTVVEFGPGTGSCTSHILRRIGPRGRLIGFDTNQRFVAVLRDRFPEAIFIHDGAQNADRHLRRLGIDEVDAIVCGLPFATIPPPIQRRIVAAAANILKANGTFMSFQYCLTLAFPRTRQFKTILAQTFSECTLKPVWLNVPPAVIVRALKNGRQPEAA